MDILSSTLQQEEGVIMIKMEDEDEDEDEDGEDEDEVDGDGPQTTGSVTKSDRVVIISSMSEM